MRTQIKWCKINGYQVLERADWPGKWIPIVPVVGKETHYENKVHLAGIVRHARDPQRMVNYWASAEAESIALAPRSPWVGALGQFKSMKAKWDTANNRNWSYLEYDPVSTQGHFAPPPQRQVLEPAVQAITNARLLASEDMKAVIGRYDASLGAPSNEKSGIAIRERRIEGDTATFHFGSHLNIGRRHAGRILVDLIPKIYKPGQMVRILGEDMVEKVITLGQDPHTQLEVGRYDVRIDSGPSYLTRRQEAADSMVSMTSAYPQIMAVGGDLLVKNLDWPGAQELADRIRKTIDPALLEEAEDAETQLAAAQGMVQQLQQQLEALNAYAKEKEEEKDEVEQRNAQLEVQAKGRQDENALKQQEIALKAEIERAELVLKEQELLIEARKEGLPVEGLDLSGTPVRQWLSDLEARVQALMRVEVQEHTLKTQPKQVEVIKRNGTLIGRVSEADGSQREFVIERTPQGYIGRVAGGSA